MRRGILLIISGPSGVGKGSVVERLSSFPGFAVSISATTRKKRDFEIDGRDYFFVSKEDFLEHIEKNDMVEYSEYCGNFYGTVKSRLDVLLNENDVVVLEIEVKGASIIAEKLDCVRVFLLPPSFGELEKRLQNRKTESKESLEKRLKTAVFEMQEAKLYDYFVVNERIEDAVEDIKAIARAESLKSSRCGYVLEKILKKE